MESDRIIPTEDGGYESIIDGARFSREELQAWLRIEQARAWATGDAARAHYCSAAMVDKREMQALLNGRPSPGLPPGGARRSL